MSSIYKLSISGVRSFEPKKQETIEFGKPLTLIVGANGVGKTTVIECLKYATTGLLPPNSASGSAFVHDPNIVGDKQVVAEVKLAFTSTNGQSMVASRSMQVIRNKTTTKFKTTEGQLMLMNRGERTTLSTKCAELDQQVPRFLGVPESILQFVIFCHQDDSLWPLSEPSALKKKFDEIFQASQFTKAIGVLKDIKKEISVEVKLLEQSVGHLKQDKARADKTREKLIGNRNLIDEYLQSTKSLEAELNIVTQESDELFKSNQQFQQTLSNMESLKHQTRSLEEQITRLNDGSRILNDSDEELQYKFANFQTFLDDSNENVDKLKSEVANKQSDLSKLRNDVNVLIREEASLKSLESDYESHSKSRESLKQKLCQEFGISAIDDHAQFESTLFNRLQSEQKFFQELKDELKTQESKLNQELRSATDKRIKEQQHKEYVVKDLENLKLEIKKAQQQMATLASSEGDIEYEKSSLEGLDSKLRKIRSSNEIEKFTNDIREGNMGINTLELEIEELNNSISQVHKQADSYAKISLLSDEAKFREQAINKLNTQHIESFKTHELENTNLSGSLKSKISKLEENCKTHQSQQQRMKEEIHEIESSLRHTQNSITQYQKQVNESTARFHQVLQNEKTIEDDGTSTDLDGEPSEYEEILQDVDNDYKTAVENVKMLTTTLDFNRNALKIAEKNKECILCHRKYDDDSLLGIFVKELAQKTNEDHLGQLKEQEEECKQVLTNVRSLSNDVEIIRGTEQKILNLKEELIAFKEQLKNKKKSLDDISKVVTSLDNEIDLLKNLVSPVNEIERLNSDLKKIKEQMEEKQNELKTYGLSAQNLDDLQKSLNDKTHELKAVRKALSKSIDDKESKQTEISILENNIRDKKLKISNLEMSMVEKESLLKTIAENNKKVFDFGVELTTIDSTIEVLQSEVGKLTHSYENLVEQNDITINDHMKTLNLWNELYNEYQQDNQKIKLFLEEHKPKLISTTEKIQSLNDLIKNAEKDIQSTLDVISIEEKKLAGTNEEFRNLRNNIDLRQLNARLSEVQKEISTIDIEAAEASRIEYQERSEYLRERYSTLNARLAGKMGEIKQIEDQIKQTEKELRVEFKDVDKNYRNELTKFKFKSIALNDADTYAKAIDTAIINFHSMKMKETNKIVEDLWKATYSGTDIDTIRIRSDPASASANSRSYNYRVVMIKNEVELDMRGRCSAGQKVLACIIIRLALSECFGTNCGVIALDEPTTNLDIENIESLARSLSTIIEMRQAQKNFQLIVITHDEKFLSAMGAVRYTDHFYRISRNQAQKSEIEWVGINRVSE